MDPITEEDARAIFKIAGIPVLAIYELAHRYYTFNPQEDEEETRRNARYRATRPSWLVKTPYGLIELNLRKNVVEIDWKDTGYRAVTPTEPAVPMSGVKQDRHPITSDNVTKTENYVHAWTMIKAVEYLSTLRDRLADREEDLRKESEIETMDEAAWDQLAVDCGYSSGAVASREDMVKIVKQTIEDVPR